ncbi:hypothetical protein B5K05_01510 [Rhizobium phaseoli]|nr:hypothetical protein B5K04_01510 [Rhizobium phaseoli]RDJ19489.1 hypothetical protein B5K05_01510 [Rhizobium phaseoli]
MFLPGHVFKWVKTCINVYDRADNMHGYTFSEAMKQGVPWALGAEKNILQFLHLFAVFYASGALVFCKLCRIRSQPPKDG